MTISERTQFLEDNPDVEQLVNGFPGFTDSVHLGRTKTADGFNDLMKQIKKNNHGADIKTKVSLRFIPPTNLDRPYEFNGLIIPQSNSTNK